ncbi:transglutaminaseTgpA domain-containing protein [Solwaraspora sp. WMMA2080]|uniref:transglutaminase-like domain-containing protein n=1 Tax=unclassified Solwaraspora TaxID=2627926 RepID=UPI00248AC31D|nr:MULTISPECIES: transglutaminaseTgpA domain-containing protein [unclassified Solwaraspora]WBC00009.1 transglutaminaseTgpA domain-containing protein [Solwaraspora sp. WMMA2059]WBC21445.1 transglutaminaseTgpA domain-containing protein [Solwaraspora sp. WMMA2080]
MTGDRTTGLARLGAVAAALIAMTGSAAVLLGRIYDGAAASWLIAGAGAAAVLVGTCARRLPNWQVAPLSVLLMGGYLLAAGWWAADRAELAGPVTRLLADAAANGVPRLLTAMIPMEAVPDTVVVPVVASWLAGFTATELAVRARRMLLGCLPPLLLFGAAAFVVGPNAEPARWPALLFVAAAAVGLLVTAAPAPAARRSGSAATVNQPSGPRSGGGGGALTTVRLRTAAVSFAGAATVLLLVAVSAPWVVARIATTDVDPRRYVAPPQVEILDENPLIRISGWALNPDQPLFDLRVGASPPPAVDGPQASGAGPRPTADGALRLTLAVLHDYDGVTWRVGGTYRNAGRVLPPVEDAAASRTDASSTDAVRQEITVAELSGRLLPAITAPVRVDGVRVAYDRASSTLLHPEGLTPGVTYAVDSVPRRPPLNALTTADVPAGESVARTLRVADGVPAEIRRLAQQLARDNGAPYQRALAVEQFLADHYQLVADAPSGHAYPNLGFFLFGPRDAGGQQGTSEQFAAAYALLSRLMGLPTRVVVGFVVPSGDATVHGRHAVAWPEVLFSGVGWVPFDPLPRPDSTPRPIEEEFRPAPDEPTPSVAPSVLPTVDPTPSTPPSAASAPPGGRPSGWLLGVVAATVAGAGAAGWAGVVLLLRRRLRDRRLDSGLPAHRVCGAWLEVVDALRLAGHPAGGHMSASEVAGHGRALPDGAALPRLDPLAELVNLASFAPGQTDDEQARRAGGYATVWVAALRARRPWWQRVIWSLDPGPLRWERRRRTAATANTAVNG